MSDIDVITTLHGENARLRDLLARWVSDADSGVLDGVDLDLMVESEEALELPK